MKKVLVATLIAGSTIGSAFAADLPSRKVPVYAPPPPVFTWSGFYVGLNAGGTFGNNNNVSVIAAPVFNAGVAGAPNLQAAIDTAGTSRFSTGSKAGAILGAQAGYNWQFGTPFLLGVEADIQGVVSSGSRSAFATIAGVPGFAANTVPSTTLVSKRLDYLGTVRGRVGYLVTPTFLIYATGGLAYSQVKSNTSIVASLTGPSAVGTPFGATGGINSGRVGYTVGGGVEWMFMPSWSLKAEYLYYDLRSVTYNAGVIQTTAAAASPFTVDAFRTRIRYDGHIGRLGVNYHFWGPSAAPVVARY